MSPEKQPCKNATMALGDGRLPPPIPSRVIRPHDRRLGREAGAIGGQMSFTQGAGPANRTGPALGNGPHRPGPLRTIGSTNSLRENRLRAAGVSIARGGGRRTAGLLTFPPRLASLSARPFVGTDEKGKKRAARVILPEKAVRPAPTWQSDYSIVPAHRSRGGLQARAPAASAPGPTRGSASMRPRPACLAR